MKYIITISITFFLMLNSLSKAMAEDVPYSEEAIIYEINYNNGSANLGDIVFNIPLDINVHTNYCSRNGIRNLKSNTTIGYTYQNNIITEVWVLDRAPIDHSVNDD